MKKLFLITLISLIGLNLLASKFVLTKCLGQPLKTPAYFFVGNQSNWILDYRNGSKITYKVLSGTKYNPLCEIKTVDNNGDLCEICITKSGNKSLINFKYKSGTIVFEGYYSE